MEAWVKLHDDKEVFEELVLIAANSMGLPQAYVEKDYWVTRVLANLAGSLHRDDFVFKGGTSLSKVHGLIHRFSEDVDLAVCNKSWGDSKRKKQLKAVGEEITAGLTYLPDHPGESKRGNFRKTYYQYPRLDEDAGLGHASDKLLLEINAMAAPEPHSREEVQSLVAEYLIASGNGRLVERYHLQPFRLKVLDVQRTAAEKIIALVKASREGGDGNSLRLRIRHVYDLCMIFRNEKYVEWLDNERLDQMLGAVCDADRRVFPRAADWLDEPLHEASLFAEPYATWALVSDEFEGPFSRMVYRGDLPASDEIIRLLGRLGGVLKRLRSQ
ncbi:hypothetical protein CEK62_04210 [Alcanivorax sp. N3-2A]|nr:hypothetical protein CEK62_04210 [Alcanivorax sp. N3-2A]